MTVNGRQPFHIYNSLHRKKEEFKPLNPPHVGLYVCGPTVYGDPHLGHARSAITFDVVWRYLDFLGYKVRYVRNITDVGHLEDEIAGQGEDKIVKKARLEQLEPMEIAQRYTNIYHRDMEALNCRRPGIEPTATGHVLDQISLIKKILENGFAYEVNGSVYFDLDAYMKSHNYGELSGKVLDELQSGSRYTEGMDEKRNPHDFALWKKAYSGHIMKWPSPWSIGFPGWHIECTAMSTKYLGEQFDIHGGGLDLQFPHHEAEIAQCKAAHNNDPARYWVHNNMVTIDGAKMSKSAGNFITLEQLFNGDHELLEKAYSPMVARFLMMQSHYRSKIDFSNDALLAAEKGYQRLMNAMNLLDKIKLQSDESGSDDAELIQLCEQCHNTMNDDLNTAQALAALFELSAKVNGLYNGQVDSSKVSAEVFELVKTTMKAFVYDVFGLEEQKSDDSGKTAELIELFIALRKHARENKDFATSDKIRDDLAAMGIHLKDEKGGTTSYEIRD